MATTSDILESILDLRSATPEADLLGSVSFSAITANSSQVVQIWEGTNYIGSAGLMGAATIESGTFTGTLTGCTTSPTVTFNWRRIGHFVTMYPTGSLGATSNTTACTVTGMSARLAPAAQQGGICLVQNNGTNVFGYWSIAAASTTLTLNIPPTGATGFTAALGKGLPLSGNVFTFCLT